MRTPACAGVVAANPASAIAAAIVAMANEPRIGRRIAASLNSRHVPAMLVGFVISALGNKSASLNYIKISFSVFIILDASNDTPTFASGDIIEIEFAPQQFRGKK
jgi:hypothetical protein